jgi:hypothetical protein
MLGRRDFFQTFAFWWRILIFTTKVPAASLLGGVSDQTDETNSLNPSFKGQLLQYLKTSFLWNLVYSLQQFTTRAWRVRLTPSTTHGSIHFFKQFKSLQYPLGFVRFDLEWPRTWLVPHEIIWFGLKSGLVRSDHSVGPHWYWRPVYLDLSVPSLAWWKSCLLPLERLMVWFEWYA